MSAIRRVVLVSVLCAFAVSAHAAPRACTSGDSVITTIKNYVVKILDEVGIKIGLPPG